MKNYILVHGLNESLSDSWGPYLKKELSNFKGNVYMPELPKNHDTSYQSWKESFDKLYDEGIINKDSVIVTHSLSTNFVIRYLIEKECKINTYIAIAGFSDLVDRNIEKKESIIPIIKPFLNTVEERKKFTKYATHRYAIYSNMDYMFSEANLEKFAVDIKAQRIILGFGGHFDATSKVKDVSFVVDIIKEINQKDRKSHGRVVFVGQEEKVSEASMKRYKEVKEYLATIFRYVTTPLTSIEHVGVEKHKFKRYTDLIKESDVVVIDVAQSIDVGVEMMMAISMQVPTIVVAKSSISIPDIVLSAWGEKNIHRYRTTDELLKILDNELNGD